jgi:hypothetical protein
MSIVMSLISFLNHCTSPVKIGQITPQGSHNVEISNLIEAYVERLFIDWNFIVNIKNFAICHLNDFIRNVIIYSRFLSFCVKSLYLKFMLIFNFNRKHETAGGVPFNP